MLTPQQTIALEAASKSGQAYGRFSSAERLSDLNSQVIDNLLSFAVLAMGLNIAGLEQFFECRDRFLSEDELFSWLVLCLERNLLMVDSSPEIEEPYFVCPDEVYQHFIKATDPNELHAYHLDAHNFLLRRLAQFAIDQGNELPTGDELQTALIGPGGFLDTISHLPQYQSFHESIVNYALNWHEHLFQLEKYDDAAHILNAICFALARRGQRKLAENLLARIANKTNDLTSLVARANLATLLREEMQHSAALKVYWQIIPGLLRRQSFLQLAQVLGEIGAIYRHKGNLVGAVMILEFCVILNGWLKNGKSQAIARSQLASAYRQLRMYLPATTVANEAISFFRQTNDLLNLGRTLLTQGNIFYNLMRANPALECFDEAFQIGQQIADPQAMIGSISGKARVLILLNHLDEALTLLQEAIRLREKNSDHTIGIEYQNLGVLYEKRGNFSLALVWHKKALIQYEKYMPGEVPSCRRKVLRLEKKLARL